MTPGRDARTAVFACITGGGTGGHIYPAIAIADALVRAGHPAAEIHFVGAARGMEATAVPAAGYTIDLLPGRGLRRSWRAVGANVRALLDTVRAFTDAWRILGRRRPRVVIGVGGYASVPTVLAARVRRIPVVVHEQNATPGLANRIAVRLGARAAVSLPDTPLPRATLTGNPLRGPVVEAVWRPATDPRLVAVVGGSLGARRLNDAALGVYDRWRDRHDVAVRHVAGRRNHDACVAELERLRRPGDHLRYELVAYEDDMPRLYSRAQMMVARAGAVTVAELAAVGVPSVLVPLPGAPGDHQTRNARALVDAGAAVLLPDADCDGAHLAAELDALLAADAEVLGTMHRAARSLARPDAADAVVALVEASAR